MDNYINQLVADGPHPPLLPEDASTLLRALNHAQPPICEPTNTTGSSDASDLCSAGNLDPPSLPTVPVTTPPGLNPGSGKLLAKPHWQRRLASHLRLRLPRGPFGLGPAALERRQLLNQASHFLTTLPKSQGYPERKGEDEPRPLDRGPASFLLPGPSERKGEDEPRPLSKYPLSFPFVGTPEGKGEDEPRPLSGIPLSFPFPGFSEGKGEDEPRPPSEALPFLGQGVEKGEDEPHPSINLTFPDQTLKPPGAWAPPRVGPATSDPSAGEEPLPPPKKRRTRRAGRKTQLRRILREYYTGADSPTYSDFDVPPPPSEPRPPKRRPRVVSDERYEGPRIRLVKPPSRRWRLYRIKQTPTVYPGDIPCIEGDPRYKVYIAKRASVLYPLPGA